MQTLSSKDQKNVFGRLFSEQFLEASAWQGHFKNIKKFSGIEGQQVMWKESAKYFEACLAQGRVGVKRNFHIKSKNT